MLTKDDLKVMREYTQDNHHTGALMFAAIKLNNTRLTNIFTAIDAIHNQLGYMPQTLVAFRDEMKEKLFSQSSEEDRKALESVT